jgi:hypothetical protein
VENRRRLAKASGDVLAVAAPRRVELKENDRVLALRFNEIIDGVASQDDDL